MAATSRLAGVNIKRSDLPEGFVGNVAWEILYVIDFTDEGDKECAVENIVTAAEQAIKMTRANDQGVKMDEVE